MRSLRLYFFHIILLSVLLGLNSPIHAQTAQNYYEHGLELQRSGDFKEAIKQFDKATGKDRKFAEAHYGIGLCYLSIDSVKSSINARLRAQHALERALKIEPKNTKYLFAMGEVRKRQGFPLRAQEAFEKIVEIDPESPEAVFDLAEAYLEQNIGGIKNLEKGVILLKDMSKKHPDYPGVHYLLGKMYLKLEQNELAQEKLLKLIEIDNENGSAKIYLATAYYRTGQLNKVSELYLRALEQVTDIELLEDLSNSFRILLSDDEKSNYLSLSPKAQASYMADFWRDRDSNMMTLENERLIEHIRRVDFVKQQYHDNSDRGFDDRGEIYLKYGEPDNKHIDSMPSGSRHIYPNESWLYDSIDTYLAFDFVSKGSGYEIVPDLSYASTPNSIDIAATLYRQRSFLGGIYAIIGSKIDGLEDFARVLSFDYGSEVVKAIANSPAENYILEFEETPIVFPSVITQFKGPNGRADIEVYIGYPHDQYEFNVTQNGLTAHVETKIVISDSNRFLAGELNRNYTVKSVTKEDNHSFGTEKLMLTPGSYKVGIQQKQVTANKLGIYQSELAVRDFRGEELMLSDIRIASGLRQADFSESDTRDKLEMLPYPFSTIPKNEPLLLYFEIYNLNLNQNGNTRYTLTYSIVKKELNISGLLGGLVKRLIDVVTQDPENILISTERTGSLTEVHELIALDLSSLDESDMTITVQIEDNVSGNITTISKDIKIVK